MVLLVEDPVNLFYLTGMHLSAGSRLGEELFVDGRYFEACKQAGMAVRPIAELKGAVGGQIAVDSSVMSAARVEELRSWGVEVELRPRILQQKRAVKRTDELAKLRAAAALAVKGYEFAVGQLKEGVSEREVACELQAFWFHQGGEGASFEPIIAFGPNSALPHHRSGARRLKRGDLVLIDLGVQLEGYQSDMTRVVSFHGELGDVYEVVREAQRRALEVCRAGARVGELDDAARGYIEERGFGEYFTHSLGHGLGLEVHEWPVLKGWETVLEAGMVITIEPGVYLPAVGGVRWEDAVVVTEGGYERLVS
jgi:Xaa-Pro aminopeptidase